MKRVQKKKSPHVHAEERCEVEDILEKVHLKKTKDRHNLVALFLHGRVWTLNQLTHDAHHSHATTVFRNVHHFLKTGLINIAGIWNGETYYEWAGQKHHDHKLCNTCAAVECVPCPIPQVKNHRLELTGACSSCK